MRKSFILSSLLLSQAALASEGLDYFGTALQRGSYEESGVSTVNPTSIKFSAGKYITSNFAIEGQFMFGLSGDSTDVDGTDVELELKNAVSVFGKGELPINSSITGYGLLGFTRGKLEVSAEFQGQKFSDSESESSLSYGFGTAVKLNKDTNLIAEYISYLDEDEFDYTSFNLGININF